MKNKFNLTVIAAALMSTGLTALASDVYIEQAGNDTVINITQDNGMNRVNTSAEPAIVSGNSIRIDLLQDGDGNVANINLSSNSNETTLNYSSTGSFNDLTVDFDGAIGNEITATVIGDENTISVCGSLNCSSSSSANDTTNTIDVTGHFNTVRLALGSDTASNTVNIVGGTTSLTGNTVDITQTGATGGHIVDVGIIGNTNNITVIQGQ